MELAYRKIGRVSFSIDKNNLRLRAVIGSNLTFLGGNNGDGYFKSMNECNEWLESKKEELSKIKSMRKLIYV